MAGLVPAIHVFARKEVVDARHKAGHDEIESYARFTSFTANPAMRL